LNDLSNESSWSGKCFKPYIWQMKQPKFLVPTAFLIIMVIAFCTVSKGLSMILTFVPGLILSYIFYLLTVYRKVPEHKGILPLFLLGIGWQGIHFAEEFLNGYQTAFPAMFGAEPYSDQQFLIMNMTAILFYCFAAAAMYLKIQGPWLISIFFIFFGGLINAAMHLVFNIVNQSYFPGFYTSLPFWLSPLLLYWIWKETR